MAGTVIADSVQAASTSQLVIQNGVASTPPQFNDGNGTQIGTLCRAWVNFNGTLSGTITPRASFNVSSITKNGTGDYTIGFTTALPDTNYCITGAGQYDQTGNAANGNVIVGAYRGSSAVGTTSCRIGVTATNLVFDAIGVYFAVFR